MILLDAVSGKSQYYELKDVPKWVDRVYSADNVLERVNDYYTYQRAIGTLSLARQMSSKQQTAITTLPSAQTFTSIQESPQQQLIRQT